MTRRRGLFGLRRLRGGFTAVATATAPSATATAGDGVPERTSVLSTNILITPASKPSTTVRAKREPTPREIRDRAYYIYLARGGVNGDPAADWIRAERELRQEFQQTARPQ